MALRHIIGKVFDGAPVSLVRRLVETEDLTARELDSIRRLLERRRRS